MGLNYNGRHILKISHTLSCTAFNGACILTTVWLSTMESHCLSFKGEKGTTTKDNFCINFKGPQRTKIVFVQCTQTSSVAILQKTLRKLK